VCDLFAGRGIWPAHRHHLGVEFVVGLSREELMQFLETHVNDVDELFHCCCRCKYCIVVKL
jgi:hypothetical protein